MTGNSIDFPKLALGVMRIPDDQVDAAVHEAIDLGYRAFDTSPMYRNEGALGRAIRTAPAPRDSLLVTTKLWNTHHAYDDAIRAGEESLKRLGLDYIDLYLVHWPAPGQGLYGEAWRALIELRRRGLVRAIGVSNFLPEHLKRIIDETGVTPLVNQVELHPSWQQRSLRAFHAQRGIRTQAWSPLMRGAGLDDPEIIAIAAETGLSPAQLILHWLDRRGVTPVVKASSTGHLRENIESFARPIDEAHLARIDALDRADGRFGMDPATFETMPFDVEPA